MCTYVYVYLNNLQPAKSWLKRLERRSIPSSLGTPSHGSTNIQTCLLALMTSRFENSGLQFRCWDQSAQLLTMRPLWETITIQYTGASLNIELAQELQQSLR